MLITLYIIIKIAWKLVTVPIRVVIAILESASRGI